MDLLVPAYQSIEPLLSIFTLCDAPDRALCTFAVATRVRFTLLLPFRRRYENIHACSMYPAECTHGIGICTQAVRWLASGTYCMRISSSSQSFVYTVYVYVATPTPPSPPPPPPQSHSCRREDQNDSLTHTWPNRKNVTNDTATARNCRRLWWNRRPYVGQRADDAALDGVWNGS